MATHLPETVAVPWHFRQRLHIVSEMFKRHMTIHLRTQSPVLRAMLYCLMCRTPVHAQLLISAMRPYRIEQNCPSRNDSYLCNVFSHFAETLLGIVRKRTLVDCKVLMYRYVFIFWERGLNMAIHFMVDCKLDMQVTTWRRAKNE